MVTGVNLMDSLENDACLRDLRRFPKLRSLGLLDRQLGPGMDDLKELPQLQEINILSASGDCLKELRRLPQLESVKLWNPIEENLNVDVLTLLPNLTQLAIMNSKSPDSLLAELPPLPQLQGLRLSSCYPMSEKGWRCLEHVPNLTSLDVTHCQPVTDFALMQMSKLKHLQALMLRDTSGEFTVEGLKSLGHLEVLAEIVVQQGDLNAEQLKALQDASPRTKVTVR